jgi:hypothetical protein
MLCTLIRASNSQRCMRANSAASCDPLPLQELLADQKKGAKAVALHPTALQVHNVNICCHGGISVHDIFFQKRCRSKRQRSCSARTRCSVAPPPVRRRPCLTRSRRSVASCSCFCPAHKAACSRQPQLKTALQAQSCRLTASLQTHPPAATPLPTAAATAHAPLRKDTLPAFPFPHPVSSSPRS